MAVDFVVILLLAGGFLLGFWRSSIRQMLALGAWLVMFLLAANLSSPIGRWLAVQAPTYSTDYAIMLAFGALFVLLFTAALIVFEVTGTTMTLSRHLLLDNIVGGVLGVILVLLFVSSLLVVLDSYHAQAGQVGAQIELLGEVHRATQESVIAEGLRDSLIPLLGSALGQLLPAEVRAVMV